VESRFFFKDMKVDGETIWEQKGNQLKRTQEKVMEMLKMNQVHYVHVWKCQNETHHYVQKKSRTKILGPTGTYL
jgi:hypothetical protein